MRIRCSEAQVANLIRSLSNIQNARILHANIIESGLANSRYLLNHLIQAYGFLGSFSNAYLAFRSIATPNLHSCNILLAASTRSNPLVLSWQCFQQLPLRDLVSWNTILSAAAQDIDLAELIFKRIPSHDIFSSTSLLHANAQAGQMVRCFNQFLSTPHRSVFSWTILMNVFCQCGEIERAMYVFERMPEWNSISWTMLLTAYAKTGDLLQANDLFTGMLERDDVAWVELLQLHVNAEASAEAFKIFNLMPCHNVVAWNVWISRADDAEAVFERVPQRDFVSWNTLLMRVASSGSAENKAKLIAEKMPQRDLITWNMILLQASQFASDAEHSEALFFEVIPEFDSCTWNTMIQSYTSHGRLEAALTMFARMPQHDPVSATLIVSSLGQANRLEDALEVLTSMPVLSSAPWNSLIETSSRAGNQDRALELFRRLVLEGVAMNELEPGVASVLAGFSHAGSVEEARGVFRGVGELYGVNPSLEHYSCMIDLLSRCEQLEDAKDLIESMPLVPCAASWTSLLGACRVHGDVDGCISAASRILDMDSQEDLAAAYVLLSNVYSR